MNCYSVWVGCLAVLRLRDSVTVAAPSARLRLP